MMYISKSIKSQQPALKMRFGKKLQGHLKKILKADQNEKSKPNYLNFMIRNNNNFVDNSAKTAKKITTESIEN